jgi:translocation and assembly module TamB
VDYSAFLSSSRILRWEASNVGRRSSEGTVPNQQRKSRRPSRSGWVVRIFFLIFLFFVGLLALAPTLLSSASLANAAIARFAGLQPLRVSVGGLSVGWISPVSLANLRVEDQEGNHLVKIERVSTEKGLLGWLMSPYHLGIVQVDGVEADLIIQPGTSNLEEALAGFSSPQSESSTNRSIQMPTGSISINNASLRLSERGRAERWLVDVPTLNVDLPTANQLFGPIELKASIVETSGTVANSQGHFKVQARHTADGSIELRARLDNLCLQAWDVLSSRLPEIPVMHMNGWASGMLAGSAIDAEHWTFEFQQFQVDRFEMLAPELIGPSPARLHGISGVARATLNNSWLQITDTSLVCDVGSINLSAAMPWPVDVPTLQEPFIRGGAFTSEGNIDLPQLVQAAQSLLPIREDIQLISGNAKFLASQQLGESQQKDAQLKLTFSDVRATNGEQSINWNDPLVVQLTAQQAGGSPQFGVVAQAEFCDVAGWGTFENGQFSGTADLDLLHQRLNQFMDLPVSQMAGSAQLQLSWSMDSQRQVAAKGDLKTTPILIASSLGGETREPAWTGDFTAAIELDPEGLPVLINQLHLELIAPDEQLVLDIHEPFRLKSQQDDSRKAPAAFSVAIQGDLANWKRRGWVWLSEPPDADVSGKIQMAVSGRMGVDQVQISQANWDLKPVAFRLSDWAFAEPQLIGNFKGNIDSIDWTRLQVDQLTVQANSFWVVARDESTPDGQARSGQARWMLDLQRLSQNLREASAGMPSAQESLAAFSGSGTSQGELKWLVNNSGASFQVQGTAENLVVYDLSPQNPTPTTLWAEPLINLSLNGYWSADSGGVQLSDIQARTPWASYQGQLTYRPLELLNELKISGQAAYDAAQLTKKLEPSIGRNIQLFGQQNMPIDVLWQWSNDPSFTGSKLSGLNANARLGWTSARVVGIEVGAADVPISINSGVMVSRAEIPVSGGVLRWDVQSDLTQEDLTVEQKPMTVLENVAITPEMCGGWLKYVAPLLAEATSIDGRLSLTLDEAKFSPGDLKRQTVQGKLVMHRAEVGPGPLANELTGLIRQIDALRRAEPGQAVSSTNRAWIQLPSQQISFRMVDGKVYHRDLRMEMGDVALTTSGAVDTEGGLDMRVSLPIPDVWADRGPVLATLRGQTLQFPVRGTVARPQLDASMLGQFGRQALEGAAQGLLQQGINRGLERLFRQQ